MNLNKTALAAAVVAAFSFPAHAVPVSVELALLVDVSGSVSTAEYNLQKGGYVNAFNTLFNDPSVANFISTNGPIAVTYIEWSGTNQQSQLVGWTSIGNATESQAFATAINGTSRAFSGSTAPGSAINFAVPLFTSNSFEGDRWVIDVSGDGVESAGANTAAARDAALAAGVDAINGLAIGSQSIIDWYNANIKGGVNGFVLPATFESFAATVQDKIGREVTNNPIPEPAALGLLGLGLVGLGLARRRRG